MKTHKHVACVAALLAATAGNALAQGFSLEGAVIDSRSSQSLGVVSERGGDINALFRAQKAMTFGILRSAGISLEQLPPEVRARIERFATTNIEAFRAYSQGLDLKDQGKFVEAREFFRRAAELDPNFALAAEQRQAMPDVNLGGSTQTRALVLATAGQAVDRGKATFVVDAARAAAAISAGASVVVTTVPPAESTQSSAANGYTTNPAGSSAQFAPNLTVALTYNLPLSTGDNLNLATSSEWRAGEYRVSGGVLESVGSLDRGFLAQRNTATASAPTPHVLGDGTTAYWGSWASTSAANTAIVNLGGVEVRAPGLGPVNYVIGDATRVMPTTGQVAFTPVGGSLGNVTGTVAVNFGTGNVAVQNLAFNIGNLAFTGLNGSTTYSATSGSGAFNGNYSSGICTGCTAFSAGASTFGGNFIGRSASGMAFSTFLFHDAANSVSGVHLFKRP